LKKCRRGFEVWESEQKYVNYKTMSKKSICKNYIYNVGYQLLLLVVPLVTTPYISSVLGPEGIGVYSYTTSIASYFVIFAVLGTATFGQREIAYQQQEPEKRSIIFWEIVILRTLLTLIMTSVYLVYAIKSSHVGISMAQCFYLLSVATDISWFFQGLEEFRRIVIRNIILKCFNIAFIFLLVKKEEDLLLYVFGMTILPFIGNLLLWKGINKFLVPVRWKELKPFKNVKECLILFIPGIAMQIYTVLDKTMIGLFTSVGEENGYYEQAQKIVQLCLNIITSLGVVMVPRIAFNYSQKNKELMSYYMYRSYRFVFFLGIPFMLGLIAVSDMIVPWFFGEEFTKVVPLLKIFSVLFLSIGLNNVTGVQYLIPTKRQKVFTITVIMGAVVNLAMNLLLIPEYLSLGAASASVAAETVIAIAQFIYLIYIEKTFKGSKIFVPSIPYWFSGVIMFVVINVVKANMQPTIMNTVVTVSVGGIVYLGILLFLKDSFLLDGLEKVLNRIKGK